jgi:hypothetical protein
MCQERRVIINDIVYLLKQESVLKDFSVCSINANSFFRAEHSRDVGYQELITTVMTV